MNKMASFGGGCECLMQASQVKFLKKGEPNLTFSRSRCNSQGLPCWGSHTVPYLFNLSIELFITRYSLYDPIDQTELPHMSAISIISSIKVSSLKAQRNVENARANVRQQPGVNFINVFMHSFYAPKISKVLKAS